MEYFSEFLNEGVMEEQIIMIDKDDNEMEICPPPLRKR
jgi:hypothetical protein